MFLSDVKVGMFIRDTTDAPDHAPVFVGTVVGITLNALGEPILMVDQSMVVPEVEVVQYVRQGWKVVPGLYNVINQVVPQHAHNITPLCHA